ncbi:hypothetical protein INQ51_13665 [Maribellus sp. CM-23]|uniref:hypothetical protein n=1 Tax=Maribellus sp. CM-23 TaxID=2781026 RepID=UPI001F448AF5|nr:hypothetical protein [Maribellus sp. CM-23]MCE4565360.1 hypothetical protein [Maribellus sp. CM-23]
MKKNNYIFLVLILIVFGCSTTSNISEIKELSKIRFDSLSIQPDVELYNFRIDINRQTTDLWLNDSTTINEVVPYNVLGFNLGNGLFYDLNDNLSLRVDYLLNIDTKKDFEIEKIYSKSKWNRNYKSQQGKFSIGYPNKKNYDLLQIDDFKDSLSISYRNKHRYSIVTSDSLTELKTVKGLHDRIQKKDKNFYYQKHRKRVDEYKLLDKAIILDDRYKITQNQNGDIIQIYSINKKGDYLRYSIIQDDKNIFIYDEKFYGKKIIKDNNKFTLYYNDTIGYGYKKTN